jgi:phosphoglycolate phosphatase-like HAD superfamily hydrolase
MYRPTRPNSSALTFAMLATLLAIPSRPVLNAGEPARDVLPSWNEGAAKKAIVDFVARVTTEGGPDFVPPGERIAAFDNDGTLWCEQPVYVQTVFVLDRARLLAAQDPSLKEKPGFQAILSGVRDTMARISHTEIAALVAATHAGMTPGSFEETAKTWFQSAQHPRFRQLYKKCLYQPQLELLAYLRASGFKVFIVTGGGIEFVRAFAEEAYEIPPERVIGSSTRTRFETRAGMADLIKLPEINSINDREGKPININLHIGRRPILAFGNSDGDLEMLEFTAAGKGARLSLLVHHDDAAREYAYDRTSLVGKLDKALDAAQQRGWSIVSMKNDWRTIFPPVPSRQAER